MNLLFGQRELLPKAMVKEETKDKGEAARKRSRAPQTCPNLVSSPQTHPLQTGRHNGKARHV
jgi:hypothetical protein